MMKNVHDVWQKEAKMQQLQEPTKRNIDSLNNAKLEVTRHFRKKRRNIRKPKLLNLKRTVKPRILETCFGGNSDFKRVTSLELIQ